MPEKSEARSVKIFVEMPKEMVARLSRLSAQIKSTGGPELEIPALVRTTLEVFFEEDHLDTSGVTNENQLVERILESFKKNSKF